jgi:superfamily II DNA/RNA helicase
VNFFTRVNYQGLIVVNLKGELTQQEYDQLRGRAGRNGAIGLFVNFVKNIDAAFEKAKESLLKKRDDNNLNAELLKVVNDKYLEQKGTINETEYMKYYEQLLKDIRSVKDRDGKIAKIINPSKSISNFTFQKEDFQVKTIEPQERKALNTCPQLGAFLPTSIKTSDKKSFRERNVKGPKILITLSKKAPSIVMPFLDFLASYNLCKKLRNLTYQSLDEKAKQKRMESYKKALDTVSDPRRAAFYLEQQSGKLDKNKIQEIAKRCFKKELDQKLFQEVLTDQKHASKRFCEQFPSSLNHFGSIIAKGIAGS